MYMSLDGLSIESHSFEVRVICSKIPDAIVITAEIGEKVSELPWCDVFLETKEDINVQELINLDASVSIKVHDSFTRYFVGIIEVASFENIPFPAENNVLHIRIVPALFRMQHTQQFRSFQETSTKDIIQGLLKEYNLDYALQLSQNNTFPFCIQYGESDFRFLLRITEEAGAFFRIRHELSKNTIEFSDNSTSAKKISTKFKVIEKTNEAILPLDGAYGVRFRSSIGTGTFLVSSFKEANAEIVFGTSNDTSTPRKIGKKEYYDDILFLEKTSGDKFAKNASESDNCTINLLTCYTYCPEIEPGTIFKISGSRTAVHNGEFFVISVKHFINQTLEGHNVPVYYNEVTAIPSDIQFRPPRLHHKNRIFGSQIAIVTGVTDEEIFCNEDFKIKVRFPWDSNAPNDEKSSCWVRVAQTWAGHNFGALVTPGVGMRVVVVFLNGDPERPLVIGCVYDEVNPPPPYQKTVSTFLSRASNEIRFDDKTNEEEVFVHAQKDMSIVVENSVTETVNEGSKTIILESKKDPTLHSLVIKKGDKTVTLTEGDYSVILDKGNQSITLKKGNQTFVLSDGDFKIDVTGSVSIVASNDINLEARGEINVNSTKSTSINSKDSIIVKAMKDFTVNSTKTTLKSQSATEVSCLSMAMDAQTTCNISALSVKVEAKANLDISANAAAVLKSTALLQLQGTAGVALSGAMIKLG
ncbi:MAG: type VI secretion system tip protein VgrG [Holosporales bacterium]|jgi:type VI secretion system secreted protein VgrG|nr:type VI secretion system tip protein VgrG [Holosporales bacterium]